VARTPARRSAWTAQDAERWLLGRELFGMRFGLDRMRRLMTALDAPHERFRAVHVVGTNGKSSTVRMTAAILARHGLRVGAYLSPHLVSFAERVRIGDEDLGNEAFAAAVARAAHAAELVDRTLAPGDRVTQFEALTAAALDELARQGVEVAVVEAGLGGRFDATNVLRAEVDVLTNVGLEHTRWLGPTVRDIAREKLAVVDPDATLVVGAGLHPDAEQEAQATAAAQGVRLVHAAADAGVELVARGAFQRRNFATARAAAEALLGSLDAHAVAGAAASTLVPGRFQVVDEAPTTVLDGAHNPGGMAALAESLPAFLAGEPGPAGASATAGPSAAGPEGRLRPLVAVLSVLDDKDAAAMLRALLPLCADAVFTANANPRALPTGTLASLARQLGGPEGHEEPDPRRALALARELAGPGGVVLATGSIYLIADLLRPAGAGPGATL
jgi:dihydrofolate synthase/folylpolyglutamate synthase